MAEDPKKLGGTSSTAPVPKPADYGAVEGLDTAALGHAARHALSAEPSAALASVRESIQQAARTSGNGDYVRDNPVPPVPFNPMDKPSTKDHAVNDHAVLGLCEILALMFGLPPGEALFRGEPLSLRLVGFIVAGAFFAALGPGWPTVRKKFPQQTLILSVGRIAADARYWLAIILVGFLYAAAPEIYRRAVPPQVAWESSSLIAPAYAPRSYVKTDIERLLSLLPALSDLMDRGNPLNADLTNFLNVQPRQLTLAVSIADAKLQVVALQNKFSTQRAEFYSFLNAHAYDRDELNRLIDWSSLQAVDARRRGEEFGVVVVDLGNYANALGLLPPNSSATDILKNKQIWDFYVNLSDDQKRFYYWLTDTRDRINKKRTELELALRSAK